MAEIAALFAAQHVRMGFHPNFRIGIFLQGRLKHIFKRGCIRTAALYRHIAKGLINHQHPFFFRRPAYQAVPTYCLRG